MTCAYIAFTARGLALAQQLAAACPGSVARGGADGVRLTDWTAAQFAQSDALIFVGAAGIAVRAIAPHCRSKAADPAVVVLDEGGQFAIPLLSGHLGGANELAQRLAAVCHAVPVITTATDGRGVFAVDEWAKRQNCAVAEPERIRCVSGALLAGQSVCYAADWAVSGTPPAGVEPAAAAVPHFTAEPDGSWSFSLAEDAVVYGLGEMPRGINKRGWHCLLYTSPSPRD